jgi:hypothetical protein
MLFSKGFDVDNGWLRSVLADWVSSEEMLEKQECFELLNICMQLIENILLKFKFLNTSFITDFSIEIPEAHKKIYAVENIFQWKHATQNQQTH